MSLSSLTSKSIPVKAKSIVAQMAVTNVVPPTLTPKNPQESEKHEDKRAKSPDISYEAPIKVQ